MQQELSRWIRKIVMTPHLLAFPVFQDLYLTGLRLPVRPGDRQLPDRQRTVSSLQDINSRLPWINEPDSLNCHADFEKPADKNVGGFNRWTRSAAGLFRMRTDDVELMCEACHGATHANYPATNIYDQDRDNIPLRQYQGNNRPIGADNDCALCHTMEMEDSVHHPNMLHEFRNRQLMRTIRGSAGP